MTVMSGALSYRGKTSAWSLPSMTSMTFRRSLESGAGNFLDLVFEKSKFQSNVADSAKDS